MYKSILLSVLVIATCAALLVSCGSDKGHEQAAQEEAAECGWQDYDSSLDSSSAQQGVESGVGTLDGYDAGYKMGYDMGYAATLSGDDYDPYLPVGPNVCSYTHEFRSGYAAGYSAGYEKAQQATAQGIYAPDDDYDDYYYYEESVEYYDE